MKKRQRQQIKEHLDQDNREAYMQQVEATLNRATATIRVLRSHVRVVDEENDRLSSSVIFWIRQDDKAQREIDDLKARLNQALADLVELEESRESS